jgi:serine acetyltransferase
MPGVNIAGEVTVGEAVLIGSGANILNRIALGDRCRVGMGAVVINDVNRELTVVGVPAKPVRK